MTPKEKAEQIVKSMEPYTQGYHAIHCALIAVEEIIKVVPMYTGNLNPDWQYWQDVKTEIEKL